MTETYPQGPTGAPYVPYVPPAAEPEPEPGPSNPIVVTPAAVSTGRREGDVAMVTPA